MNPISYPSPSDAESSVPTGLAELPGDVLFCSGPAHVTARDVVDAAWLRGWIHTEWRAFCQSALNQADAEAQGLELDLGKLQSMSEEFRYHHNLVTVEETERWLSQRALTEDDFVAYLVRQYWLLHAPSNRVVVVDDYAASSAEQQALFKATTVFSGAFDKWARELSWRYAALQQDLHRTQRASPTETRGPRSELEREELELLGRGAWESDELQGLAERLGRDTAWVGSQIESERAYQQLCEGMIQGPMIQRLLVAQRIPLTRVELETIWTRSLDEAREAILCIQAEEQPIEEFAEECDFTHSRSNRFLEDLPQAEQQMLFGASEGEVLGPTPSPQGYAVMRVSTKVEPSMDDPAVRKRVVLPWLQKECDTLAREHVQWVRGDAYKG